MRALFEGWSADFAHAARRLFRAPGFTLVTVATLALAIGANTAIFSVVDAVLIDPLSYPDADRLVTIRGSAPGSDLPGLFAVGPEFFVAYRDDADLIEDIGMFQMMQATARTDGQVDRLFIIAGTSSLFTTLGVQPLLGRLPNKDDDAQRAPVMVIRAQMGEALLLALLGGAGVALLARFGVPLLVRAAPERVPNLDLVAVNPLAILFTVGRSILAACVFGLVPAVRFSTPKALGDLRQTGRVGTAQGRFARNALVVLQTACALVLLVATGLLGRSFSALSRVDLGFEPANIFTFQVAPQRRELNDGPSFAQFHQGLMERIAALPRVESVGVVAERALSQLSFTALMLAIASALALILGAVGLYGVLSYVVSQRTREIAVRLALGAETTAVRRMVVLQGGRVALLGVGIGILAALAVTGVLKSLLFGVKAFDAPTFMAMSGVMLGVAIVASYIPAYRASSVDPMQALRGE